MKLCLAIPAHKNVCKTLGICNSPYAIIMELADHGLNEFLRSFFAKSHSSIKKIITDICSGMAHLHVCKITDFHCF